MQTPDPIAWDENAARVAINDICSDALARFDSDRFWPPHPADEWAREGETNLYWGATGNIWALDYLARAGAVECRGEWRDALPLLVERNRAAFATMQPHIGMEARQASFLMGDIGPLLLGMRIAPDDRTADELHARISDNLSLPPLELMWGIPGTMLACIFAHAMAGEGRWRQLYSLQAAKLLDDMIDTPAGPLWRQQLYGRKFSFLGVVHGFAGNMLALLRGFDWLDDAQQQRIRGAAARTLAANAVRSDAGVNWRPEGLASDAPRLVQICHGAPGMIVAFADNRVATPELRALLCGAGELVWRTGPLEKGSNLCHGTAGNGYALLKLLEFTGDSLWLARARDFAMHAIGQFRDASARHGRGRYSLWTGDMGLAVYLWDCLSAIPRFPTLDVF